MEPTFHPTDEFFVQNVEEIFTGEEEESGEDEQNKENEENFQESPFLKYTSEGRVLLNIWVMPNTHSVSFV